MDKELKEKCLDTGEIVPFQSTVESTKKIKEHNNNSDYYLKAAKNLLESDTPNVAVVFGFFAIEQKANALIALNGYDMKSHKCTPLFLSRELNLKELATSFNSAVQLRLKYNYKLDLKSEDSEEVKDFINNDVVSFIEEVDKLLKKIR